MKRLIYIFVVFLLAAAMVSAETVPGTYDSREITYRLVEVAGGLSRPWALAFLPDGDLLVTERTGDLKRISGESARTISGVPKVASIRQGGLLDVVLDPDFPENRWVYLSFSGRYKTGFGTQVGRGRLVGDELQDFEVIFTLDRSTRTTHHYGSRLVFGLDGTLFITVGDRGDRTRAQSLADHAGKILRIHPDGSVPEDNPFVGVEGALPEIYSYGHRNAQGLVIDHNTGVLWAHEHGPQGGDEVNIIKAGINYGWPVITYGREYSGSYIGPPEKPGFEQPVIHWTPSIAPSGLALYTSDLFSPWKGSLFAGALAGQHLRRMVLEGTEIVDQEVLLKNEVGRIRDVRQGPEGYLWILIDAPNASLYRIEPVR